MISTVTFATVSAANDPAFYDSFALICILTLLLLLVLKEFTAASDSRFANVLNRVLNIGIVPLMVAFVLIVSMKILEIPK